VKIKCTDSQCDHWRATGDHRWMTRIETYNNDYWSLKRRPDGVAGIRRSTTPQEWSTRMGDQALAEGCKWRGETVTIKDPAELQWCLLDTEKTLVFLNIIEIRSNINKKSSVDGLKLWSNFDCIFPGRNLPNSNVLLKTFLLERNLLNILSEIERNCTLDTVIQKFEATYELYFKGLWSMLSSFL